eukprot:jgi/Hompol1/4409/HPOL_007089-RA
MAGHPHPIFCYGTLMSSQVFDTVRAGIRIDKPLQKVPAILRGAQRFGVKGKPYPGMIPSPDAEHYVEGLLVYVQSDAQVAALDVYETNMYRRELVQVQVREQQQSTEQTVAETVTAQTYWWDRPMDTLTGDEWDLQANGFQ